jgi:uncharacterized BrkB/YihY/UPF0761 family membrane protein
MEPEIEILLHVSLYFLFLLIPFIPFLIGLLIYVFGSKTFSYFRGDCETNFSNFRKLTIWWIISTIGFFVFLTGYIFLF